MLLVLLRQRLDGLEGAKIADSFARITVAAAMMGASRVAGRPVAHGALVRPPGCGRRVRIVGGDIGVGLAVLGAAARSLRIAEFDQAMTRLAGSLRRRTSYCRTQVRSPSGFRLRTSGAPGEGFETPECQCGPLWYDERPAGRCTRCPDTPPALPGSRSAPARSRRP